MADKKTRFDIFLENSEKIKSDIKTDKEAFLNKIKNTKELKTNQTQKKSSLFNSDSSSDPFSRLFPKEKMDALLDKLKNKNKK